MKIQGKPFPLLFLLILIFLLVGGILAPKVFVRDASGLSQEEIACARRETRFLLDNPLERALVLKLVVSGKEGENLYVDAFTLWGLKYARVWVVCDERAEVVWRAGGKPVVNSFEACAAAGYPVMESYPRQCKAPDGRIFIETPFPTEPPGGFCVDLCGDGICQEVVCMALGCPCAETRESCPADCK